ncbi:MAG: Hpt domain-containing protein [Gemmatimonadetes bacterium]|nr:Hpt domain-containing protein [Gemmatimonadota bacterium]
MSDASPVVADDFNALLELLDRETMREVVQLFLAAAPTRLETARQAVTSGNAAVAATALHTMRSGCGQLGARRLEELCATGEREAKHGDLAAVDTRLSEIDAEFARCLEWFHANGWSDA